MYKAIVSSSCSGFLIIASFKIYACLDNFIMPFHRTKKQSSLFLMVKVGYPQLGLTGVSENVHRKYILCTFITFLSKLVITYLPICLCALFQAEVIIIAKAMTSYSLKTMKVCFVSEKPSARGVAASLCSLRCFRTFTALSLDIDALTYDNSYFCVLMKMVIMIN